MKGKLQCEKIGIIVSSGTGIVMDLLLRLNYEKKKDTEIGYDFLKSQGPQWCKISQCSVKRSPQHPEGGEPTMVRYDKDRQFKSAKIPPAGYFVNHPYGWFR